MRTVEEVVKLMEPLTNKQKAFVEAVVRSFGEEVRGECAKKAEDMTMNYTASAIRSIEIK